MSAISFASDSMSARSRDSEHGLWVKRKGAARNHRRRYEKTWMECQLFAAGKQWAEYNTRTHRVLVPDQANERKKRTQDVLMQYVWTVLGALASDDFRPAMAASRKDEEAKARADFTNKALGYAWEQEFDGDDVIHDLLVFLAVYGTGGIRCRYDRSRGPLISEQMPYQGGEPMLEPDERARYMDGSFTKGESVQMGPLREGAVVWEPLSPWNMLPQPGVVRPRDFRWEIVVRPVPVDELRQQFPEQAALIEAEAIDSMDVLGTPRYQGGGDSGGASGADELQDSALLYTGYEHPGPRNPRGQTVLFTEKALLGAPMPKLPYKDDTGCVYFKYWPVPGRFWGRGFMEPGMEAQRTLNKRETQVDEIIDRDLPKVFVTKSVARKMKVPEGLVLEVIEVPDNSPEINYQQGHGPGTWMFNDLERLKEAIADALGTKRVALGENPPGVANFSQLSLIKESEATKLGTISQRFNLGLASISKLTVAAMKNWPKAKKLLIVGADDELEVLEWSKSQVPDDFVFRPAKRGSQPRGPGAELAKVQQLWDAAVACGAALRNPLRWLDWLQRCLSEAKVLELPDDGASEQQHKAALENLTMGHSGVPLPVAPYDIGAIHIPEHNAELERLSEKATLGDQSAAAATAAIEQHLQMHAALEARAQAQMAGMTQAALPMAPATPPGASAGPPQAPAA